jgi:hypothetical protein
MRSPSYHVKSEKLPPLRVNLHNENHILNFFVYQAIRRSWTCYQLPYNEMGKKNIRSLLKILRDELRYTKVFITRLL